MLFNELHQGGIRALLDYDNTIFDNMVLPDDVELADVADHIIMKYGDAPLFSPDPSVVKYYIGRWSARRLPLWERYKAAIEADYDPIENYNRIEDTTHTTTPAVKYTTETEPGSTVERFISADNSSTYVPDNKETGSGKDTVTQSTTGYDTFGIDSTIHGNIGVTTSQQMLTSELDLIPRLDLIDYIADDWHSEFNLMIYM